MFKSVFKTGIRGTYSVSENATFHSDSWAVYPAKHKQTGKIVSVFIFDKPKFETQVNRICNSTTNTRNPRHIIAEYYEQIRTEVSNLTKLKHPQILTVLEVLEETKSKFLFVTEAVMANLANLKLAQETSLSLQKGLLEVSKALQFLHNNCGIIHMNLQPSSVFVSAQGDWKLAGFKFLQNLNEMSVSERENFYIMNSSSVVEGANNNLNFTAPELITDSAGQRLGTANDMWGLGMLIFYLYNKGDYMINCLEVTSIADFKAEFRKFEQKFYNRRPADLRYVFKAVPENLWAILMQLLARYPTDRISIDQFIDSDFFDGSLIKMMWFVDEFSTKTVGEKIVFLDGLIGHSDLLPQLPSNFRNNKLLTLLTDSIKSEIGILPTKRLDTETDVYLSKSLMLVFTIGDSLSNLSFQDRIHDKLLSPVRSKKSESPFVQLFSASVKIRLAVISNMETLLKKLTQKQMVDLMKEVPTICVTASTNEIDQQSDQVQLQDLYLNNLSLIVELFDFPYIKNTLFPLICSVFKTTTILSTKIQTIKTFEMLIEKKIIDKIIVSDQLLPVVENLKSRDKRIVGTVVSFFVRLSTSRHIDLDLEILVEKIYGQCLRLIFACSDCSKGEFQEMMAALDKIQQVIVSEKLDTLSESPRDPSKENFSTLISSASVRERKDEPVIKGPVLRPTSASPVPETQNRHTNLQPQSKPLTLTPSRPTQGLRFGATSAASNAKTESMMSNMRLSSDSSAGYGAQNSTVRESTPSRNTSLDWSSADTSTNSPSTTMNSSVLQPQNTQPSGSASSWTPMATTQASAHKKLPPGFSGNIMSPSSTGSGPTPGHAPVKPQTTGQDLLDFL